MMINDLKEIKTKIYEQERIEELLNKMGCQEIKEIHNRFEAMLPEKFNPDNPRSVQCYKGESLSCRVRTRGMPPMDIFGLVSYLMFDCGEQEFSNNLPKAKAWICEQLGYHEYIDGFFREEPKENPLKWLQDLKKSRNRRNFEPKENQIYDDSILNQYIMLPHILYLNEGIDYQTQVEFQVGFDLASERIIWPIHNQWGDIISIKGRTIDPDYKKKGFYKFLYLYNYNKMIEFYNWHRSLYYILQNKEIVIYEGEKTSWLSSQYGVRNCVAIGGDDISEFQVQMIKNLGLDISIVLGFDKDKTPDDIKKQARKFGFTRSVYAMWDGRRVFSAEDKHSPTDKGKDAFLQLYNDRLRYKIC